MTLTDGFQQTPVSHDCGAEWRWKSRKGVELIGWGGSYVRGNGGGVDGKEEVRGKWKGNAHGGCHGHRCPPPGLVLDGKGVFSGNYPSPDCLQI